METFEKRYDGGPIPPKVWNHAIEILCEYASLGEAWVKAGRPRDCQLYADFTWAEAEYNQMADAIWFANWTVGQKAEWSRTFHYDPYQ